MQKQLPLQLPISLVKYETPIQVKIQPQQLFNKQPPEGKASLRDILNVLLPPRKIIHEVQGKKLIYIQYADESKLSRDDVDILKQKMEEFLKSRKAKDQPICPIRQKIFAQSFSQLIRQVLIDNPQRGIMLSRVRNEAYLTIAAYTTLYEESLKFSKAKLIETENNLTPLQTQQQQLLQQRMRLKQRQNYLYAKKQLIQQKSRQVKTIYKEKRERQMQGIRAQEEGLKLFLEKINRDRQEEEKKLLKLMPKLKSAIIKPKEDSDND